MLSELAFRAQLVIREQRELFDYWRGCAGSGGMPSRSRINPAEIPALLPGISILDAGKSPDEIIYRLAGRSPFDPPNYTAHPSWRGGDFAACRGTRRSADSTRLTTMKSRRRS